MQRENRKKLAGLFNNKQKHYNAIQWLEEPAIHMKYM